VGIHSGEPVELALCPAESGSGIVFVLHPRGNLGEGASNAGAEPVEIPARADAVVSTRRATTLSAPGSPPGGGRGPQGPVTLTTVEHLLATLYVLEIDNVRIELDGPEVPVMDGSAAAFFALAREAGRVELETPRSEFEITRPLEIVDGERWIRVSPCDRLKISYAVDFDHEAIRRQSIELDALDAHSFERELAGARTFGFAHEVEALRRAGLARGGSLENTVVLSETGVVNEGGLRWPDEFVRHKVIDLLGDLALLGGRLRAHLEVERGGHSLHHRLVRALVDEPALLRSRASASSGDAASQGWPTAALQTRP